MLAMLACSQGVPMLTAGDEMGRTQRGNNNAYCQDNDTSWVQWTLDARGEEMLAFTRELFALRRRHPTLRRRSFFRGAPVSGDGSKDVTWLGPGGRELTGEDWGRSDAHVLGMLLHGEASDERDDRGRTVPAETLLVLVNGGGAHSTFTLPAMGAWKELVNTARPARRHRLATTVELARHTLALLQLVRPDAADRPAPDGRRRR